MYNPRIPPIEAEDLLPYLDDELVKLATSVNDLVAGLHEIRYNPPERLRKGMVVYADGVEWNPGSGEGLYRYNLAGNWVFIG